MNEINIINWGKKINQVHNTMREYQKENNIKGNCMTNCLYLSDIIKNIVKNNGLDICVKTIPVYVLSTNSEEATGMFVGGHVIISIDDDTFIEPSYEVYCLKNREYFTNINDLVNRFDDKVKLSQRFDFKTLISQHIEFIEIANKINNGEFMINDMEYYNKQGDYVEKKCGLKIEKV